MVLKTCVACLQEALLDLYVQEDDFASQACQQFELAYQARRFETKQAKLVVVQVRKKDTFTKVCWQD